MIDGDGLLRPRPRHVVPIMHAASVGTKVVPLLDAEIDVGVIGRGEALHRRFRPVRAERLALRVGHGLAPIRRRRPIDVERHGPPPEPAQRGEIWRPLLSRGSLSKWMGA